MRTFNEDSHRYSRTGERDLETADGLPNTIGGAGAEHGAITDTRKKIDQWLRERHLIRSRLEFTGQSRPRKTPAQG